MDQIHQKGYVLPIVLILVTSLAILSIGLLPNITAQIRFNRMDEDRLIAQYAAEAGAKTALRQIQQQYDAFAASGTLNAANLATISSPATARDFMYHADKSVSSTYTVSFAPDNTTKPDAFKVISTGRFNGKHYTVKPIFSLKRIKTGGIKELFSGCTYSHKDGNTTIDVTSWDIDTVNNAANPPDNGFYQVLFTGSQLEDQFSLAYNCACKKINSTTASGYGIYYGSTGDADNMTSYVFQYDPGAYIGTSQNNDGGSFFVKKCRANSTPQPKASANEWIETTTTTTDIPKTSFYGTVGTTTWSDRPTTSGSGMSYMVTVKSYKKVTTKSYKNINKKTGYWQYTSITYTTTTTGQYRDKVANEYPSFYPFQVEDTTSKADCLNTHGNIPDDSIDNIDESFYRISLNDLKSYIEYKKRNDEKIPGYTFDIYGTHKITIKVVEGSDKNLWHMIYCDGYLILKFVDTTVTCPITFEGKYSGLRVWNAQTGFYDTPSESYGQGKLPIIWTK
jgi:hypothetical protein